VTAGARSFMEKISTSSGEPSSDTESTVSPRSRPKTYVVSYPIEDFLAQAAVEARGRASIRRLDGKAEG